MKTDTPTDFFALARIAAASCYGRADTRDKAIKGCAQAARGVRRRLGFTIRRPIHMDIYDLSGTGVDNVYWDDFGVYADGEPIKIGPEPVLI